MIVLKNSVYTRTKNLKPFEFGDIFIYAVTLLLVVVLFIFLVITPKVSSVSGFSVTIHGDEILSFNVNSQKVSVNEMNGYSVEVADDELGYLITVKSDDGHFNKILFNFSKRSAKVVESNCSISKDCTFSPAITTSGTIICAPHGLKIVPILSGGYTEPITG